MFRPFALFAVLLVALTVIVPQTAQAQEPQVWVQVEAHPDLETALDRARAYSALFPETVSFRLGTGWFVIALGPYPADEAPIRLGALKREGQIPSDSYIADGTTYGAQVFPADSAAQVTPETPEVVTPDPVVAPDPVLIPDEDRQQARDGEALLTPEDRKDLQAALQWFGFYPGAIDGAYGPGTRTAMAAWQEAQGMVEPTGILTTRQRAALLSDWRNDRATFGFTEVVEAESGISVTLPMNLVEFDHYEPPFVHYRAKDATAPRILLISQPGDQAALYGLYDVLQTLDAVPLDGPRDRNDQSFRIRGTSASTDTTVFAGLQGGRIKGWMLISAPGNEARDARILKVLEDSFRPDGESVLDPGMVAMAADTKAGLLAGLEVRKPNRSRSGFFISADGLVATTVEAVERCGRVTIDRTTDAEIVMTDAAAGLALLKPKAPLSPRSVAAFAATTARPGGEITVPGYSYEDRLPAPVLTFGTVEDGVGLDGKAGQLRLSLQALPGDAGGAVLDPAGAVVGMLLPASVEGGKQMPLGVAFALSGSDITRIMTAQGIPPQTAAAPAALTPAALAETATGMTALVSCWD